MDGVPFDGSYWVLALGPEVNNKYQWSIVTDKTGVFLFVLARDVDAFKANYDASVKRQLNDLGYKGLTGPLPVYQGKNCKYEADIRRKQIEESFCSGCNN